MDVLSRVLTLESEGRAYTLKFLLRGETWTCPYRAQEPYTHWGHQPVIVIDLKGKILKVIPARLFLELEADDPRIKNKDLGWMDTGKVQIAKAWVRQLLDLDLVPDLTPPKVKKGRRKQVPVPVDMFALKDLKSRPFATRADVTDRDYIQKLNPGEQAWLNRFIENTELNHVRHDGHDLLDPDQQRAAYRAFDARRRDILKAPGLLRVERTPRADEDQPVQVVDLLPDSVTEDDQIQAIDAKYQAMTQVERFLASKRKPKPGGG